MGKKLEKILKTSETQLQSLNASAHQLRATCYGQDRYWRRYWSLPKAGGIFIEAMESADPELLNDQEVAIVSDSENNLGIKSVDDINRIIRDVENDTANDPSVDNEVNTIVGEKNSENNECVDVLDNHTDANANEHRKTPNRCQTPGKSTFFNLKRIISVKP